jgi:hypothetical protein
MSSCEEAMYYLNSCGSSRLDGYGDGIPCESLCRWGGFMKIITILLLLLTNQAFAEEETIDKETIMFACDIYREDTVSQNCNNSRMIK